MSARSIHPFPARMAPEIVLDGLPEAGQRPLRILDPMCGSGTVLVAAQEAGHIASGIDIDPLAVLMSQVATSDLGSSDLRSVAACCVDRARRSTSRRMPWTDSETETFASYWFGEKQRVELARISHSIKRVEDLETRRALQIALSRIIVTKTSRASLAADTAHSRPHRVSTESTYDVYDGFQKSVVALAKLLSNRKLTGSATVKLGDSRSLEAEDQASYDWIVTSPPYLNAIDYMRGHKLSLIWLGYSIPILRAIRSGSIGAERALDQEATPRVEAMLKAVEAEATSPDALPSAIITRYAHDLCGFADQMSRVLKAGGQATVVVGNSTIRGNYIRNDELVAMAMSTAGMSIDSRTERELPDGRRYMAIPARSEDSRISKRMRTEVIIRATRNAPLEPVVAP